jgi:CheY-like chemotaxis protein
MSSRTVIAAVDDLFFAAKIRATAEHLGVEVRFVRSVDALIASARERKPELIIVDLQSQKIDPIEGANRLKTDHELSLIPVLGFFSHVLTEWQQRAKDAGYTHVMPRSAFSSRLPEILNGQI